MGKYGQINTWYYRANNYIAGHFQNRSFTMHLQGNAHTQSEISLEPATGGVLQEKVF